MLPASPEGLASAAVIRKANEKAPSAAERSDFTCIKHLQWCWLFSVTALRGELGKLRWLTATGLRAPDHNFLTTPRQRGAQRWRCRFLTGRAIAYHLEKHVVQVPLCARSVPSSSASWRGRRAVFCTPGGIFYKPIVET